jgi:hypothetical protein
LQLNPTTEKYELLGPVSKIGWDPERLCSGDDPEPGQPGGVMYTHWLDTLGIAGTVIPGLAN